MIWLLTVAYQGYQCPWLNQCSLWFPVQGASPVSSTQGIWVAPLNGVPGVLGLFETHLLRGSVLFDGKPNPFRLIFKYPKRNPRCYWTIPFWLFPKSHLIEYTRFNPSDIPLKTNSATANAGLTGIFVTPKWEQYSEMFKAMGKQWNNCDGIVKPKNPILVRIEHTHKPETASGSTKGVMPHEKPQQCCHQSYSTLSLGAGKPSYGFCDSDSACFFWGGRFGENLLGPFKHAIIGNTVIFCSAEVFVSGVRQQKTANIPWKSHQSPRWVRFTQRTAYDFWNSGTKHQRFFNIFQLRDHKKKCTCPTRFALLIHQMHSVYSRWIINNQY